jgi:cyclohexyl-isocyanide hydratase
MDMPITISDRNKPVRQSNHLTIGGLIFPRLDQIDMTGPFEVLSRIPNSAIHVIAKTKSPVRDIQGLILTPEMSIAEAPELDVLLVPGGFGQQQLMNDEEVLSLIRNHFTAGRLVFSVCTGALLCGAAAVLRGRQATTHWATWNLLPYYGAIPVRSRAVVDGNLITAAGVTAGLDAALVVASLLRGGGNCPRNSIEHSICAKPCVTVARLKQLRLRFCKHSTKAIPQSQPPEKPKRHFAAILGIAAEARSTFLLGD